MLRDVISYEWFTIFMVLGLVFIAIAKVSFTNRFIDFLGVFGNSKYLKLYTKDQKFIDVFDALLFLNLVISISIFGYLSYLTLESTQTFELDVFLKFMLGVTSLALVKILAERLIGSVFEIDRLIDAYLFQKISYKNFSGFVLLPINALLLYTINPSKVIIFAVISLLIIINVIGFITSFKNHQKTVIDNIFYFILYLCALEIGPYLILYKIIVEYKV
ncbi:uncharacterized protein DUF4271 [Gelidibacter algens]|uniref:Uncharacterized protein DUF4271 n=1 Tax=Gelidibacter algens TaxID=49280 RepID=A0A1A7R1U8_9FLAO|nr:DUF4271 domain-containing protein [Gelidibacter algens]OBX24752.1 hypothetical protein A9996_13740 [Gelidibacter algens]RAJ19271.1 uncharacterized protein DUF4271 [Gelidibacter algens]